MYSTNPYGVWNEGHQRPVWGTGPTPSILGALPTPAVPSNFITLYFTSFEPTIPNCTIVGARNQVYYRIDTDSDGYTVIKNSYGSKMALIEWQNPPSVELRNVVPKQRVDSWLKLSSDKSVRIMEVRGMQYIWAPAGQSINLYTKTPTGSSLHARILRNQGSITLEVDPHAIPMGLLDSIIVATFLLQCGRNID